MAYLTDRQAIEIWKAKWRRQTVQSLVAKFGVNQFRLYEVWSGSRNRGTMETAYEELKNEDPLLAGTIVPTYHVEKRRVISRSLDFFGQQDMFDQFKVSS